LQDQVYHENKGTTITLIWIPCPKYKVKLSRLDTISNGKCYNYHLDNNPCRSAVPEDVLSTSEISYLKVDQRCQNTGKFRLNFQNKYLMLSTPTGRSIPTARVYFFYFAVIFH